MFSSGRGKGLERKGRVFRRLRRGRSWKETVIREGKGKEWMYGRGRLGGENERRVI